MTAPTRPQTLEACELLPGDQLADNDGDDLTTGATLTRVAQLWPSDYGDELEVAAELEGVPAWVTLRETDAVHVVPRPHLHQLLAIAWRYASTNDAQGAQEYVAHARAAVAELEQRLAACLEGAYANSERLRVQHMHHDRPDDTTRQLEKRRAMELAKAHAYGDALALLTNTTTTAALEAAAERRLDRAGA